MKKTFTAGTMSDTRKHYLHFSGHWGVGGAAVPDGPCGWVGQWADRLRCGWRDRAAGCHLRRPVDATWGLVTAGGRGVFTGGWGSNKCVHLVGIGSGGCESLLDWTGHLTGQDRRETNLCPQLWAWPFVFVNLGWGGGGCQSKTTWERIVPGSWNPVLTHCVSVNLAS